MLTIALGIGVNAAIFSVIQATLLDPLPFREPERLVHIAETHPEFTSLQVAAPDYRDWVGQTKSFEQIAAHTMQSMNQGTLKGAGEPEQIQATQASHELAEMMGIRMLHGRWYTAEEEKKKARVAVLHESFWRRKFSADASIVGRTVQLDHESFVVVGIVSKRQAYPEWADFWMPLSLMEQQLQEIRRFHTLEVVARLKPGVDPVSADAEMRVISEGLAAAYPETNKSVGVSVLPLVSRITGDVRPALLIAWAAVGLVLLLACANVAHLVMVRSVQQSRELSVRAALGATRGQLWMQLVRESLCVAGAGGLLGLLLAQFTLPLLQAWGGKDIPRLDGAMLSTEVIALTITASLMCALLLVVPAGIGLNHLDLYQSMKQSSGVSLSQRRSVFGGLVIAAEVALAFVVVVGAGLLYASFVAIHNEDGGFDSHGVVTAQIMTGRDWPGSAQLFQQQIAPRLLALPGVKQVASANAAPMTLGRTEYSRFATRFGLVGRSFEAGRFPVAQLRWVSPEYFETLRIPLKSGRYLRASEAKQPGYVINETLAKRFFPGEDPVGKFIVTGVVSPSPQNVPILGVVGDVRDLSLDEEPRPTLYSWGISPGIHVLVRVEGNEAALLPAIREVLRNADSDATIRREASLSAVVEGSLAKRRFALYLLGAFAALAILLTAVGVYGVISYSVSRRVREFAIRFALGAQRWDVRRLVLLNFALPTVAGLAVGGWLAYLFAKAMHTQLYKLSPYDPGVLLSAAGGLVVLVVISALRPAGKAASVPVANVVRE